MKKLGYILIMLLATDLNAQNINSIQVIPANPNTQDTVSIIVDTWFSSGPCNQHTQQISVNGNSIYCNTLHCTGMLTVICNDADTFKINPLPTGNYTAYVQVDQGALPTPCSPGVVQGGSDSLLFTVTPFTGITNAVNDENYTVYVSRSSIEIQVKNTEKIQCIKLTDAEGRMVFSSAKIKESISVRKTHSGGFYFLSIINKNGSLLSRKIVSVN